MASYVMYKALDRPLNDEAVIGEVGVRLPSAAGPIYPAGTAASKRTNVSGANNDLVWTAARAGTWADNLTVIYEDGASDPSELSVVVSWVGVVPTITVNLATDANGTVLTTAAQVAAAVAAHGEASKLVAPLTNYSTDTGAGAVAADATPFLNDTATLGTNASLVIDNTVANSDLTFTAREIGLVGNSITIQIIDPDTNTADASVVVTGTAIAITAGYSTGAIDSTAAEIVTAILNSAAASALVTAVAEGTGAGTIDDAGVAATPLAGGTGGTNVGAAEPFYIAANSVVPVVVDIEDRKVQRYLRRSYHRLVSLGTV